MRYRIMSVPTAPIGAARENDIAIVTTTPIGNKQLNCVSAPTTRSDKTALVAGDVYIALLPTSAVSFNALPKNALYGLPGTCYQYTAGGKWKSVNAYIYQQNTWVIFSTDLSYLYDAGNQHTELGGSWECASYAYIVGTQGAVTIGGNSVKLATSTMEQFAVVGKSNLIDFTPYKTVTARYDAAPNPSAAMHAYIVFTAVKSPMQNNAVISAVNETANGTGLTLSADISALNGLYYATFMADIPGTATLHKMWLEG